MWGRSYGENVTIAKALSDLNHQLVLDIDRYSARFPKNLDNKVLLARTAMGVGRYDKAIEAYQAVITQQPDAPQILAEMADTIEENNYDGISEQLSNEEKKAHFRKLAAGAVDLPSIRQKVELQSMSALSTDLDFKPSKLRNSSSTGRCQELYSDVF